MVGMLEGGRMERLVKRIPKVGKYFLNRFVKILLKIFFGNVVENIFKK